MMTADQETYPISRSIGLSTWRRVDRVCDQFEIACRAGDAPTLSPFLAEVPAEERAVLKEQLLLIEQDVDEDSDSALDRGQESIPQPMPTKIGKYRIRGILGEGGFGTVYQAFDAELDRFVALKVPHRSTWQSPTHLARAMREARIAGQFSHRHIVRVHGVFCDDGIPVIVSELVDGQSLSDLLSDKMLGIHDAVGLVAKVARAMESAHRQGIVHRDIKPSNILIDKRGEPKITDFGLARRNNLDATLTGDGQLLGTPRYMSPEQIAGANVDERTDIYSLGVLLYELLTGVVPFRRDFPVIFDSILAESPSPLRKWNSSIDRQLERIVLKCLEKSPDDRYQSAEHLAADLEADRRGERISLGSTSMFEGLSRMMRDTHHAHLLSNYESVAILNSIILLGTELAMAYLYHDLGIRLRYLYWSICLTVFPLVAWVAHQFRCPGAFTFMERQLVCVWLGAGIAVWGMSIMEAALGLSIFTLAPAQPVIFGFTSFITARIYSGRFYLHTGAYFLCVIAMLLFSDLALYILTTANFTAFCVTGLIATRQRRAKQKRSLGSVLDVPSEKHCRSH